MSYLLMFSTTKVLFRLVQVSISPWRGCAVDSAKNLFMGGADVE